MGVIRFMKYKVGDKVRIKTWESMEKEFGKEINVDYIDCRGGFRTEMEDVLNR